MQHTYPPQDGLRQAIAELREQVDGLKRDLRFLAMMLGASVILLAVAIALR